MNEKLLAITRFYFAQSVFSNRCHYNAVDRLVEDEKKVSITVGIISSLSIMALILQIIGLNNNFQKIINTAAYIGLLSSAFGLIFQIFNKNDRTQNIFLHKMCAEKYKTLRDEYMTLIEKIMSESFPEGELRTKKDCLQKRYTNIGETAPNTNSADYEKARIGLGIQKNDKEVFTWSDSEIDKFLPIILQITQQH